MHVVCSTVVGAVSPRTLILTEEHIVLCEEDYGRAGNSLSKQTQTQLQPAAAIAFSKAVTHPISDVVAIVSGVRVRACMCLRACEHTCMCECECAFACACVCVCVRVHVRVRVLARLCLRMCARV